jgi:hypothetical protein
MEENTQSTETEKSSKAKKAVTIYITESNYKKLAGFTENKSEKEVGALATKCFSHGLKKLKATKVTKIDFV